MDFKKSKLWRFKSGVRLVGLIWKILHTYTYIYAYNGHGTDGYYSYFGLKNLNCTLFSLRLVTLHFHKSTSSLTSLVSTTSLNVNSLILYG